MCKQVILLQILIYFTFSEGSHLKIPSFSYPGETVSMECNVDHGDLPIASITWCKDGKQFYKYDPNQSDPIIITNVVGVLVKKDLSPNGNRITISSLTLESAGVYTCRVEIDHPTLNVGELSGSLKVVQN